MYISRLLTKCLGACANVSRSIDFRQLKGKFLFGLEIYPRVFPRNGITFAAEKGKPKNMKDDERQELESQIADLKVRLHKSEMQNIALNALIDVAEEQGLAIRKKCGAKQ